MPDEMHTLESFAALPDDESRNAAIARTLGWRFGSVTLYVQDGESYKATGWHRTTKSTHPKPPPFYDGGDSDPFANWGLLAEVARLVADFVASAGETARAPVDIQEALYRVTERVACDGTPHRAACLAAVAAGRVPKGGE
jgi:predicted GTPase